jgi:tetratricopeptide (TPR) repeat protein
MAVFLCLYGGVQLLWRSDWHKERLYQQLVSGSREVRASAAYTLAELSAQPYLLRALHSNSPLARRTASSALWDLWYHEAGNDAFERIEVLSSALRFHDYPRALRLADELVRRYPRFAEGWNRRATLYWLLGRYEDSIADCRRGLALNPNQFAAWQGMGLCQLHLGEVREALRSLRAARRLQPYDRATQSLLDQCQEYLRTHPRGSAHQADLTI